MVQKSFPSFEAEREEAGTAVVEAVGFDDVYCCYSGHQIFDASQVANVEEAHGGRDAVVIVVVVGVDEVPEVRSEAGKNVGVVPADEGKDEPFVEGVAQVVEHIVAHNQLLADTGYMLAELAAEEAQAQVEGDTAVAVAVVAAAFANDYFEIHNRNSHIMHFVQQGAEKAEEESIGYCKDQQEVVHVVVVQQRLPTMPNNLAVKAVEEEVQEAAEAAEA